MSALWMIAASLGFAGMVACIKLASNHHVPLDQLIFYRCLIATVLMQFYLRWRSIPVATPHWRAHLRRSLAGYIGLISYFLAISLLPVGTAVTLNYTSPLLLGATLLVIHRERPHPWVVIAMLGGLSGIVVLLQPTFDQSQWFGGLVALASAGFAAFSAINMRLLGRLNEPVARTVWYFSAITTLASLPWFLFSHPLSIDWIGIMYVIGAGVAATVGQTMITLAYHRGNTLLVSLLGYSQVVFTVLIGMLIWGDRPPWSAWLGIALVIVSGTFATVTVQTQSKSRDTSNA